MFGFSLGLVLVLGGGTFDRGDHHVGRDSGGLNTAAHTQE